MGASAKTLSRIVSLHQTGLLKNGASIIELGAQELYCSGMEQYVRDVIKHFADQNPGLRKSEEYSAKEIKAIADKGMFGRIINACGFSYRALDIFEAEATTLFDLNIQSPGVDLCEKFDLVTNFGTTEHVINQYLSMKTMHELAKPGGLIYHDLPMAGYHNHGYFSYNALLFRHLADANGYTIIMQHFSQATTPTPTPSFMSENGYSQSSYLDCGIEFIFQKNFSAPFRMPLETSTSLDVSKTLWRDDNPYVDREMGSPKEFNPYKSNSLDTVSGWDLQRELFHRYRGKFARLLGLR